MSAPPGFVVEPTPAHLCPHPGPPRFVKSQIYTEPSVFKAIDKYAVNVSFNFFIFMYDVLYDFVTLYFSL